MNRTGVTASNKCLSILGGGQLSQMIAEGAVKHQIKTLALVDSPQDSVCFSPAEIFEKNADPESVARFFAKSSHLTFENEFLNVPELRALLLKLDQTDLDIFPSLAVLELLQDKIQQKALLNSLGIKNAPHKILDSQTTPAQWLQSLEQDFGANCVLKWAKFGYDGKGTFFFDPSKNLPEALDFIRLGQQKNARIFAEQKIPFKTEAAQSLLRTPSDTTLAFPLVFSVQKKGICAEVYGPASAFAATEAQEHASLKVLRALASQLQYVGVFAVEFFIDEDGELWVNEIAPRVHNSAHYSQEACSLSQFEAHALAPFDGLPSKIESKPFFGMINILGPELKSYSRQTAELEKNRFALPANIFLHWYGKRQITESRKLGHLNFFADTHAEFLLKQSQARQLNEDIRRFLQGEARLAP